MEIPENLNASGGDELDAAKSQDGGGSAIVADNEAAGLEGSMGVAEYLNHKLDEFLRFGVPLTPDADCDDGGVENERLRVGALDSVGHEHARGLRRSVAEAGEELDA